MLLKSVVSVSRFGIGCRRTICFDEKFVKSVLSRVDESQARLLNLKPKKGQETQRINQKQFIGRAPHSWDQDLLHCGSKFTIDEDTFQILCRTTNFSVVLQDLQSNQIFTVNASSLPILDSRPNEDDKEMAQQTLLHYFDPNQVSKTEIRNPFHDKGPLVYEADSNCVFKDCDHPYLVISYKEEPNCIVFACTSDTWSPHRAPMKMLVADAKWCGRLALWNTPMRYATVADLSRMATLPASLVDQHFQSPRSTATNVGAVMGGIMQTFMAHTILGGRLSSEERADEIDTESYEDQGECTLLIGHYEIDETTNKQLHPDNPRTPLPLKEDEINSN